MSVVAVERFFSVTVELADGTSKTVRTRGESPSEVYQQVRAMPDVRRVGRVTEVSESSFNGRSDPSGDRRPATRHDRPHEDRPPARVPGHTDSSTLNRSMSGPRVVRQARPSGGEQPFRHLQAPPPRPVPPPAPPKPVAVKPVPPRPAPATVSAAAISAPQVEADADGGEEATDGASSAAMTGREYRIVKSRRRDGLPYLLQRGSWKQTGTKRVFSASWEKGFAERAQAEKHQAWVEGMEREAADLDGHEEHADAE